MSGSKVPYHLRVNKYVDRQLFIEALDFVARYQPLEGAAYISMGGGYLEDFRVLHQAFAIQRMLSFDFEEWMITRQEVNKPYGFIECRCASSTDIVRAFDTVRGGLVGPDGRVIIWLDSTEASMRWDQLNDLEELTKRLIHGDIFRITMNAHRLYFGSKDKYELARRAGETDQPTLGDWWNTQLAEQLKDYMPPDRRDADCIGSDYDFAVTLTRAIKFAALEGLKSRPTLMIEPLLSVVYADGQQMITVTGMVLEAVQRETFLDRSRWGDWQYAPGEEWDNLTHLAVPHISVRERGLIHNLMPAPNASHYAAHVPFKLDKEPEKHADLIGQYVTHHRRYPTFAPIDSM